MVGELTTYFDNVMSPPVKFFLLDDFCCGKISHGFRTCSRIEPSHPELVVIEVIEVTHTNSRNQLLRISKKF